MRRRAGLVVAAGLAALLGMPAAQTVARSASSVSTLAALNSQPDSTYVTNGAVNAVARGGQTIYIGGSFSEVGPRTGPGVGIDSSTGQAQSNLPEISGGAIKAVAGDGSGGWYIGGSFTHVGGVARHGLAHILANGSLDAFFDPSPNDVVFSLLYFDGTLYVGGDFTAISGQSRSHLAQLDPNGVATSWNPEPDGAVVALAVHQSISTVNPSTIFVGGDFTAIGGQLRQSLAQLNLNGNATSWNPSPDGTVNALAVTGGTGATPLRVYAGGGFTTIGGQSRAGIAALDANGDATSFDAQADGSVSTLAVSGSTVYVGGGFTTIGGQSRTYIAALDATTGDATDWNPAANSLVDTLAVSGGTVYAGGEFTRIGGQSRDDLAALGSTTGQATSWNPDANDTVSALGLSGTTVYAGGTFSSVGGTARKNLAAIDAVTGAPTSWNPEADNEVDALAVSNGIVYVGGAFTAAGGAVRHYLAALDASSGAATAWDPTANDQVSALALSGSTVYVGGAFTSIAGQSREFVGAVDTVGTLDSWDPNANGAVDALAVSNGTIYAGGRFTSIGQEARDHLAALDPATGDATSWNPDANDLVFGIAASGSTVYVGGDFSQIGAQTRNNLAAVETNGTVDAWNPDPNGRVLAVAVAGSTVYAGGLFGSIGPTVRLGLAAIDATTGLATSWDPGTNDVFALQAFGDGSVYAGGAFETMDFAFATSSFASFSESPANTAAPSIAAVHVGQQSSCSKGSWSGSMPQSYAYAWFLDGSAIGGAASATYTPTLSEAGHKLSCRVTARNPGGSSSALSAPASVPPPPDATTVVASAITQTSATMNGSVNPNGEETAVYFQYGKTSSYGERTPDQSVGAGTSGSAAAAHVSGLTLGTSYHFRVVASSASGSAIGADETFKTSSLMCVVPMVKGKKLIAAKGAIRAAHCSVGRVRDVYSAHMKRGRVIGQKPKAQTVEHVGAKVALVVSRGRKPKKR